MALIRHWYDLERCCRYIVHTIAYLANIDHSARNFEELSRAQPLKLSEKWSKEWHGMLVFLKRCKTVIIWEAQISSERLMVIYMIVYSLPSWMPSIFFVSQSQLSIMLIQSVCWFNITIRVNPDILEVSEASHQYLLWPSFWLRKHSFPPPSVFLIPLACPDCRNYGTYKNHS